MYARIDKFTAEGENLKAALISHVPTMVGWTYPMWVVLCMIAGIVLFVIAKPFLNGERWARALTLFCLSVPAIGGAYMFVPWMNFVGSTREGIGMFSSPAVIISFIGLIPYFAVLLTGLAARQKTVYFLVFGAIGVLASYTFGNGTAAHRILVGHPKMPMYADGIFVLNLARVGGWLAVFGLMVSIYFLYMRYEKGWYLAQVSAATAMIVGFATYYWRNDTIDYGAQGVIALLLLVMLVLPSFKKELIEEESMEDSSIAM